MFDEELIVPDPSVSIQDGAIQAWGETSFWPVWGFQSPPSDDRFATHRVLSDRPDV